MEERLWASMQKLQPQLVADLQKPMQNLCVGLVAGELEQVKGRLTSLEATTADIKQVQNEHGDSLRALHDKFDKFLSKSSSTSLLSQAPPSAPADFEEQTSVDPQNKFWRTPDQSIVFFTTSANKGVTKEKAKAAFDSLLEDANVPPDSFTFNGDQLASKFEIKFSGPFGTARARTSQLLLSLRLGPGNYKELLVDGPDGTKIQYYLNPDKNGSMVRREILTKHLTSAMGELLPGKQFFARRSEGLVFVDRRPIAQVHITSPTDARLSWKHGKRIAIGLDNELVEKKFDEICKEGGGEPWS